MQVHVQNTEQLHAHDHYQNVTEHKTSNHSIWNKIYQHIHNAETGSGYG